MLQTTNQIMFKIIHSHGLFFPPRVAVSPRVELGDFDRRPHVAETARAKRQWRDAQVAKGCITNYAYIYMYI